ncbi:unnamed protein product [Rotaria socialis]|uniref:RING-CH-type domain-containing protein n=2 Tax=Rotaria socialis TaxID=392032 RepID=A0A818FA24_9BILA|nr:unnamed protein product [Rotaria socialis]CAF3629642.1 unnamed protein product [Rotaria socialis]CAF4268193.1 unnamed protein product [Rotaria socialis]CAF4594915.1 unnamed protein product [Rotaria socialis]
MIFKIFSSKYYPPNEDTKTRSELISLMNEPLPLDNHQEQLSAVPIVNNEDSLVNEQEKHETGNLQVCRICYSTGDLQSLISPCQCSGTMGILHQNCLERWLEISNTNKCEICQHEFEVVRYPKSLFYFLRNPLQPSDIRYLINDIVLFIFLTTIISWLIIMSMSKIQANKQFLDGLSYFILPFSVFLIYIVWCWVSFRYHTQVIKEWRSVNQLIRVINKKDSQINHHHLNDHNLLARSDIEQQYSLNCDNSYHSTSRNQANILPENTHHQITIQ